MFPCTNPKVCGVQNHRNGTVCKATQMSGASKANRPQGGVTIGGVSKTSRPVRIGQQVTKMRDRDTLAYRYNSSSTASQETIYTARGGENPGIHIYEADDAIDENFDPEKSPRAELCRDSNGTYWVSTSHNGENIAVRVDDLNENSRHPIQEGRDEDGDTYGPYDTAVYIAQKPNSDYPSRIRNADPVDSEGNPLEWSNPNQS